MGVRLPPEYQEVEYLKSNRNQRIVLDVVPSITDVITIKCKLDSLADNTGIYGCAQTSTFGIGTNTNLNNFYAQIGSGAYRQSTVPKDTEIHTHLLDLNRLVYAVDGAETSLSGLILKPATNNYGLWFHNGAVSGYIRYTSGRIYFFDIKDRITLVPCYRKSDDKPGMYDLVSDTFFTNQGTGEFVVGPDVIDSISPWLVARRRALMQQEPELYPVGTKILGEYIGRNGINLLLANQHRLNDSTGAYESYVYAAASDVYVPINPKYTYYRSGGGQIASLWYYDRNKNPISKTIAYRSTTSTTITNIPTNAKYIRVQSNTNNNQWTFEITRTA